MLALGHHETYPFLKEGSWYSVKFERDFFAAGACRYAFKGIMTGTGPRSNEISVTKVFRNQLDNNCHMWKPEKNSSRKANEFANIFNRLPIVPKPEIKFIIPILTQMKVIASYMDPNGVELNDTRYVKPLDVVGIEEFIPGYYQKFNSNNGWEDGVNILMHAFSHWTWYASSGDFLVCDLQGVRCNQGFILTDPAIHSKSQIFGETDLGFVGMEMFLHKHICNYICQSLNLPKPPVGFNPGGGLRSKLYSYQLTDAQKIRNINASNFFRASSLSSNIYSQTLLSTVYSNIYSPITSLSESNTILLFQLSLQQRINNTIYQTPSLNQQMMSYTINNAALNHFSFI